MKIRSFKQFFIGLILITSLAVSILQVYASNELKAPPGYVDHDPIFIDSDQDFIDLGFPGDGSPANPYRIENYYISTDYDHYCILVASTTKHFIIQDCYLSISYGQIYLVDIAKDTVEIRNNCFDALGAYTFYGSIRIEYCSSILIEGNEFVEIDYDCINIEHSSHIEIRNNIFDCMDESVNIRNSRNCLVEQNTFLGGDRAIYISDSSVCTIRENEFLEGRYGVAIYLCTSILVHENLFENSSFGAMHINYSFQINITSNEIKNSSYGIFINTVDGFEISNNQIETLYYGIALEYSDYNGTIIQNTLAGGGFFFGILDANMINTMIIENNLIDGKELGLFVNIQDEMFLSEDYAQFVFVNCSDLTIRGLQFVDYSTPLATRECSNIRIERNTFRECAISYQDYGSEYIFLEDNRFIDCEYGLFLRGITNSSFVSNTFESNDEGIRMEYIIDCQVKHNKFENNVWGLVTDGVYRSKISENRFVRNNYDDSPDNYTGGMILNSLYETEIFENEIEENHYGMYCSYSDRSIFTKNYFIMNEIGLYLRSSDDNLIYENYFGKNLDYAIKLMRYSRNNTIYRNTFIKNNLGGSSQCYDETIDRGNRWYNEETSEGNYWDDAISGTSYSLDGDGEAKDLYPLEKPTIKVVAPSIFLNLLLIPVLLVFRIIRRRNKFNLRE